MQKFDSKPINVLFLIYDLERGGPELRLLDFAKFFPESIRIFLCVTSKQLALIEKFRSLNVDIKVIPIDKIYLSPAKIIRIWQYCKINNIEIIDSRRLY